MSAMTKEESYFLFCLKPPANVKRRDFISWIDTMQAVISSMTQEESDQTTGLLEMADIRRQFTGKPFNHCVGDILKLSDLNKKGRRVVHEFIRFNLLKKLHEFMLAKKLKNMVFKEVKKADPVFLSKGYSITDDQCFYRKKVWNESRESYRLILVGRGLPINENRYVKLVGNFDKNDLILGREPDIFSANILELI